VTARALPAPTQDDDVPTDCPQARYANVFQVGFNECEMVFDFGVVDPDRGDETMHTRILIASGHGRLLLQLLTEAVDRHRRTFTPRPGDGASD
jgi:hypothetical protein